MGNATGIIEVYGLVAAFVACDAGCKAADVTVEHFDKNKPGNPESLTVPLIVAVKFRGTVDNVTAAVEAAAEAAAEPEEEPAPPEPTAEEKLLTEIRDLLKAQK